MLALRMCSVKAAIYARISRDDEGQGYGVDRQVEDCRLLIERQGWEVGEIFTDNDVSASTSSRKPRPAYARLIEQIQAGEVQILVAYSNSRLTRRGARGWLELIDLANKGVLTIHTVVSGSHDLSTADGRAVALTIAVWDAAEAERTSERLTRQKADRAARGLPQGGRYRSYGYTRKFEPVADEAEVVRDVFERRAAGQSATSIAKHLASRGLTTSSGAMWSGSSVRKLVSRPGYAGLRESKGEIVAATAYPALVDEAVWRAANGEAASASVGTNARRWVLSGIAVCRRCGAPMTGNIRVGGYRCNRERGGCGNTKIKTAWLEGPVVSLALARWTQTEASRTPRSGARTGEPFDFAAVDERIRAVQVAFAAGELNPQDMTAMLRDLRQKRRVAENVASSTSAGIVRGPAISISAWINADPSIRRLMLAEHLRVVSVGPRRESGPGKFDPGRLSITWTDGEVQEVTRGALDAAPYWNVDEGSWRIPKGLAIASFELTDPKPVGEPR
jgi:site-specific DNA recombinase